MSLKLLLLIPKLDGYQATLGDNHTLITPSSGTIRRRKTSVGAVHRANVSFTVKQDDFDYLMAFWRLTKDKAFGCQLITDTSQIRWHRVRWASVPQVSVKGGGVFSISANVIEDIPSNIMALSAVGRVVASSLYPYDTHEHYTATANITKLVLYDKVIKQSFDEQIYTNATIAHIQLKDIVFDYTDKSPDNYLVNNANIIELVLYDKLFFKKHNHHEKYSVTKADIIDIVLFDKVVTHHQPIDKTNYFITDVNISNITLTDI